MCGCNLVTPRLIGGGPRSSSSSLAMLAAMREPNSDASLRHEIKKYRWSRALFKLSRKARIFH
jgi:hypothetical protein